MGLNFQPERPAFRARSIFSSPELAKGQFVLLEGTGA
jgi:hypothetical protein